MSAQKKSPPRREGTLPAALNLARIVYRLTTSPHAWSLQRLCEELEISERTERKYRKTLGDSFEPFRDERGSRLELSGEGEHRVLRLRAAEGSEGEEELPARFAALHFASTMVAFLRQTELARPMEEVTQELKRRAGHPTHHFAANARRLFYTVPDAPKSYELKREIISELMRALIRCEAISITYDASNSGHGERRVEPLSLVSWRSGLYLLAREAAGAPVKTYAVDRIEALKPLGVPFEYPSQQDFDPKEFTEGCFGIFREQHDDQLPVELIFADLRWLKVYLKERTWHPSQRFEDLEDGRLRMTFRVGSMMEVWPWIRQFGTDVEVIKPRGPVPESFSAQ